MTEHWPVVYELIEALVAVGRSEEALELVPRLDAIESHALLGHQGQIERCRGLLAAPPNFEGHFRAAIAHLQTGPRLLELARTNLAFGERLVAVDRIGAARDPLMAALTIFEEQACRPWADRARTALRAAGGSVGPRRPEPTDELTPQEEQVAHAVASGMTNREAADALFVSTKTIETHLTRIYRKLRVRSRTELTNALRR